MFVRFYLPTSFPESLKIKPSLQGERVFSKIAFLSSYQVVVRYWCQLASIVLPKINQILSKINFQRHQIPDLSLGALPMPQGGPQDSPEGFKKAFWGPKTAPRCLKTAPKMFQKRPQDAPSRPQDVPKMEPKSAWKETWTALGSQTPSKLRFSIVL